jgi:hypothetical protein
VPQTQYLPRFAGEVDRRERSDRWSGGGLSTRAIAAADPTRLASLADLPFQGRYTAFVCRQSQTCINISGTRSKSLSPIFVMSDTPNPASTYR